MLFIKLASENFNPSPQTVSKITHIFRHNVERFYKTDLMTWTKSKDGSNGWCQKTGCQNVYSYFMFRYPPSLRTWMSHRTWNKLMKAMNGNKRWTRAKTASTPSSVPSFNVCHQNIPWNKSKEVTALYISQIILRFSPALLFITEANPDKVEAAAPPDYTFIRGTLPGEKLCRVSLLIKVTDPYEVIEANVDVPTVAVKLGGWVFMGVYREWTHGGRAETKDRRDLELIRLKTLVKWWRKHLRGKSIIMGDFNVDPQDPPITAHQRTLNDIRDLIESNLVDRGWMQMVTEITRSQRVQEPGLLDHIYTKERNFIEHVHRENVNGEDHSCIGVKVRLQEPVFQSETFLARNVDGIPEGAFEYEFCNSRVYEIYRAPDVDEALDCLEFKIIRAANIVAPERRIRTRENYAKWMTPELQLKTKRRNAMRLRAEKSKKPEDWHTFKVFQKELNKELRRAREDDLKNDLDIKDGKTRWKRIRAHAKLKSKKGNTGNADIELNIGDDLVKEPKQVAETLNNYFKDKVVKLREGLKISVEDSLSYTDEYLQGREVKDFEFHQVSRPYVKSIIRQMSNTGALGRDRIGTKLIKRYRHVLTGPITHIVNMSIYHGVYPRNWKMGIITPLPKDGDPKIAKNWRPICIMPALSKILETVLNNQISGHMEREGLYSETQHAYRKVRSVTTALLELDTIVKNQLNKGKLVAVVTTDISAGFNLVSKEILVPKLKKFGFGELSQKLLSHYLSGRKTRVKVKNILSGEVYLDTGVGEGTVLGPNFFSCGMTDVSVVAKRVMKALEEDKNIKVFITQIEYADDCTGVVAADNEDDLQVAVDDLLAGFSRFYGANGLKLNESKCNVLVMRPGKKVKTITLAGQDEVEVLRLLGLFIDNKLSYEAHTKIVCGRLSGKINALDRLHGKASFKTLKEATVSLVHSTIEFCAELYLRTEKNQKAVQKKLNSSMRVLLGVTELNASCTGMMRDLRWLNLSNMYRWCQIRTLKRILSLQGGQTPHLWEILDLTTSTHYSVRYQAIKLSWRKLTRWAREAYVFTSTMLYNELGLHGRLFADYEDMRDQVKNTLIWTFGNANLK